MSRTPLANPVLRLRPLALLLLLRLLVRPPGVACGPWDLGSYQLCSFAKLEGVSDNASGGDGWHSLRTRVVLARWQLPQHTGKRGTLGPRKETGCGMGTSGCQ